MWLWTLLAPGTGWALEDTRERLLLLRQLLAVPWPVGTSSVQTVHSPLPQPSSPYICTSGLRACFRAADLTIRVAVTRSLRTWTSLKLPMDSYRPWASDAQLWAGAGPGLGAGCCGPRMVLASGPCTSFPGSRCRWGHSADAKGNRPGTPRVFCTAAGQGHSLARVRHESCVTCDLLPPGDTQGIRAQSQLCLPRLEAALLLQLAEQLAGGRAAACAPRPGSPHSREAHMAQCACATHCTVGRRDTSTSAECVTEAPGRGSSAGGHHIWPHRALWVLPVPLRPPGRVLPTG